VPTAILIWGRKILRWLLSYAAWALICQELNCAVKSENIFWNMATFTMPSIGMKPPWNCQKMNIPADLLCLIVMIISRFYSYAYVMTKWETGKRQKSTTRERAFANLTPKHTCTTSIILTAWRFP